MSWPSISNTTERHEWSNDTGTLDIRHEWINETGTLDVRHEWINETGTLDVKHKWINETGTLHIMHEWRNETGTLDVLDGRMSSNLESNSTSNDTISAAVEALLQVVHSSTEEQVLSILFISTICTFAVLANISIIATILKEESLHTAHFSSLVGMSLSDTILVFITSLSAIMQFTTEKVQPLECEILVTIQMAIVYCQPHNIALIAIERCAYFRWPMKYSQYFTIIRISIVLTVFYGIGLIYNIVLEILIGRDYHASGLTCQLTMPSLTINYVQMSMIYLVPAVEIVVASVLIWKLTKMALVAPAVVSGSNQPPAQAALVKQGKRALKLILLVSGAYWGTGIPTMCMWLMAKNMAKGWEMMDARLHMTAFALIRSSTFLIALVSSSLNPLIYYWSRPDLRKAFFKMVGWKSNAVGPMPE